MSVAPQRDRAGIPLRTVVPNAITALALCVGLTSVRFAIAGEWDKAIYAIIAAAVLDGMDGRIARALKGQSRFGAELDSLSDVIAFGVSPAIVLHLWVLQEQRGIGWVFALAYAVCMALRLARFNARIDVEDQPHKSAGFLTGDAKRADLPDMVAAFRKRAIGSGIAAGAVALVSLFVVRSDARDLYDGLTSGDGLVAVLGSALFGLLTIVLVAVGRYGPARFAAAAAVGAMTIGWALAQDPYILPGALTLDDAAASDTTLTALVVSVGLGMLVLVPSLWWLYRLVLRGTLDQEYEPLDQRFRPVDS